MDGRHGIVEFDIAGGVMNLRHVLGWLRAYGLSELYPLNSVTSWSWGSPGI